MKKKIVKVIKSKVGDLTPGADYSDIYDRIENKKKLLSELAALVEKELHPKAMANLIVGQLMGIFQDDDQKLKEAVYSIINLAHAMDTMSTSVE